MKVINRFMIFTLLFFGFIGVGGVFGQSTTTVTVNVTSIFDGNEMTNTVIADYGTSLSIQNNLEEASGYEFAYFVVNDVVEENYLSDNLFIVKNKMDIKAIFTPSTKNVVLFRDSNGDLLDIEYIESGGTVNDNEVLLPSKPGMIVSSNKWDHSLENITSNTIITLQYDMDTSTSFTLDVMNAEGSGLYGFNEEVSIHADLMKNDEFFSHFEEDGQIISRQNDTVVSILSNRTIEAIYTNGGVSNSPFVSVSDDLHLRGGYSSFVGHFYLPEEFTLVEYGMITFIDEEFSLATDGILIHQSEKYNPDTMEYLMSFNQKSFNYVRAYLVFKDSENHIYEMYSDTRHCDSILIDTLTYETDMEDDTKGSYASATVTLNGEDWTFDDALLGTLDGDQKNDSRSARLRNGHIGTNFTISNIGKISFYHGIYGSEAATSFDLEISLDGIMWYTVDENIMNTSMWTQYEFVFDESVYSALGLDSVDDYYIRIQHDNSERMNIDDFKVYSRTELIVDDPTSNSSLQSDVLEFDISGLLDPLFTVGDDFTGICQATDMILGDVACQISGYDMAVAGTYDVLFTAVDYEGISHFLTKSITVLEEDSIKPDLQQYLEIDYDDEGYYEGIEGLYGDDLLLALRAIIQEGFIAQSYDDARQALGYIDEDPNNLDNVLLIYNRDSVSSVWDGGTTWNREHVWPNSRLGVDRVDGSDRSIASDLHNLRACDSGLNSSRNNDIYTDLSDGTFYPGVDDQGDVARILFYMATMYPVLLLTDEASSKDIGDNAYTEEGALMGDLEDLLSWNLLDDTDSFEMTRNNRIEEYQNNRNPFIDYPYLALLIWDYQAS